ncbi:MAG TPA: YqaA family protein [Gemmatimonadota bacterium]|nr:YqaA family protein [Gemmatimonadota bacterium]
MSDARTAESGSMHDGPLPPPERRGLLRRMYDWVLGWADRPGGAWALFGIAFAESSFFPIPPDALLIPLVIGRPTRGLWFATVCTAGSVLGAVAGYMIGSFLFASIGQAILEFYGATGHYVSLGQMFNENLWLTLGTAGFTPIPFKVFTIAAGAFAVAFLPFVVVSTVSRGARFFIVAGLLTVFGERIREFVEKYFNLLSILFVILLIGGFVVVGFFMPGH